MITYARTFRLSFETPRPDGDVVIRAELHHVTENDAGEIEFISGTQHELFRLLSEVQSEPVTYTDSSGQTHTCTIADIAGAVVEAVRTWFPEEMPEGTFGPEPDKKYIISQED